MRVTIRVVLVLPMRLWHRRPELGCDPSSADYCSCDPTNELCEQYCADPECDLIVVVTLVHQTAAAEATILEAAMMTTAMVIVSNSQAA